LLCALVVPFLANCIVDTRQYPPKPAREAIFPKIRQFSADPASEQLFEVCQGQTNAITVEFQYLRPDDLRDPLISAQLVLNPQFATDGLPDTKPLRVTPTEERIAYDTRREDVGLDFDTIHKVTVNWTVPIGDPNVEVGSHTLRLLLSHEGNWMNQETEPRRTEEADAVTWGNVEVLAADDSGCISP